MKQLVIIEANNVALSDMTEFIDAISWIRNQGGEINRFVKDEVDPQPSLASNQALPITLLDGEIVLRSTYPTIEQMQEWLGIAGTTENAPCCGCCGG